MATDFPETKDGKKLTQKRIEDFTEICSQILSRLAFRFSIPLDRAPLEGVISSIQADRSATIEGLIEAGEQIGITIRSASSLDSAAILELTREGFPVVCIDEDGDAVVWESASRNIIESCLVSDGLEFVDHKRSDVRRWLRQHGDVVCLVARRELPCASLSASPDGVGGKQPKAAHPKPQKRFLSLLKLDIRDFWLVWLFAFGSGILALATPLAIESLVNVVSWGTYLQPLFILGVMLFACLGIAGVFKVLQTVVVEMIQRRQFVRIVGDLSHRFPRANQLSLAGVYPREFANRVFDIMTIQKASAVLLLDGINIMLTTVVGLLLLAFYHPFLLGFDLVLILSMVVITYALGRGGVTSAIKESATKYRIAHWLQDVIASPSTFKVNGGGAFAVARANRLMSDYLQARSSQFRVIIRQVIFAVGLQVVASTILLGLGGWLVIQEQLTLGQLVASELVVTVVVGAFAKAGKSLEKFYDLMAGVDKVGYLLDIEMDSKHTPIEFPAGPVEVSWQKMDLSFGGQKQSIEPQQVPAGSRIALCGDDFEAASSLAKVVAGLVRPDSGFCEIGGFECSHASSVGNGKNVGYAGEAEIINSTIAENISLGRVGIGESRVTQVLRKVGLWHRVAKMPNQSSTVLQTGGYPLSRRESLLVMIARAIIAEPHVLIIDGALDDFDQATIDTVWQVLTSPDRPWTLIVATSRNDLRERCDDVVFISNSPSS